MLEFSFPLQAKKGLDQQHLINSGLHLKHGVRALFGLPHAEEHLVSENGVYLKYTSNL